MDGNLNIVPIGVVGEMCIATDQMANGYLKMPEKTNASFVTNPFNKSEMIYRTGDMIRLNDNLEIELLGRKDDQVKLNGQRTEIGEIEKSILREGSAKQTAVNIVEYTNKTYLVAWLVPDSDNLAEMWSNDVMNASIARHYILKIKTFISRFLAPFMIPHIWIPVKQMPLTSHGKINKAELKQYLLNKSVDEWNQYGALGDEEVIKPVSELAIFYKKNGPMS